LVDIPDPTPLVSLTIPVEVDLGTPGVWTRAEGEGEAGVFMGVLGLLTWVVAWRAGAGLDLPKGDAMPLIPPMVLPPIPIPPIVLAPEFIPPPMPV
jgi:hypothetical protein